MPMSASCQRTEWRTTSWRAGERVRRMHLRPARPISRGPRSAVPGCASSRTIRCKVAQPARLDRSGARVSGFFFPPALQVWTLLRPIKGGPFRNVFRTPPVVVGQRDQRGGLIAPRWRNEEHHRAPLKCMPCPKEPRLGRGTAQDLHPTVGGEWSYPIDGGFAGARCFGHPARARCSWERREALHLSVALTRNIVAVV